MVNVGLIGFGLAGRHFHAPLIAVAGMNVAAIVTSRAQEAREAQPDADVLDSVDSLLRRANIDLVVIATPNHVHFEQAQAALLAGKHVVVDKPITVTAAEARSLAELARRMDRKLAVFHNRRWDCDFLTLSRLMRGGRLGAIHFYDARWDRYRPVILDRWRERAAPGAGVLYDLGAHLIDQMLCLFGRPEWVQAEVWRQRPGALVADAFELLLGYGTLRVMLGSTSLAAASGWRYRIDGSQAAFVKGGFDPQESQLRGGMMPDAAEFGIEPRNQWGQVTDGGTSAITTVESERGAWTSFYSEMRRSIEQGTPVPVSAHDAVVTIEIIEASLLSSRTGRRVSLEPSFGRDAEVSVTV